MLDPPADFETTDADNVLALPPIEIVLFEVNVDPPFASAPFDFKKVTSILFPATGMIPVSFPKSIS